MTQSLLTDDFDFTLPDDLIAQHPLSERDQARLLHVGKNFINDSHVYDLPNLLQDGDVLVLNNTKVIPARLFGTRGQVRIEFLLLKPVDKSLWTALAKPAKRLKLDDQIEFEGELVGRVLHKNESGILSIHFSKHGDDFLNYLEQYGQAPLPPYIHRGEVNYPDDKDRYQTVFAHHRGSVAAPTAGLHFTEQLLQRLHNGNKKSHFVTLHVGAGTFLPVKTRLIDDHIMHAEFGAISEETASAITRAKREGRRIVAVGTTSARLLETAAQDQGILHPFAGETNIFIKPGYSFKIVDVLFTNFHLPRSTLFMLVSAFGGKDRMRQAYAHAIQQGYRFYSYGDATLLEKS